MLPTVIIVNKCTNLGKWIYIFGGVKGLTSNRIFNVIFQRTLHMNVEGTPTVPSQIAASGIYLGTNS